MIYFANASGAVVHCVPERVFQGASEGNKIFLVAPFAPNESVSAVFRLPSGESTRPYLLTYEGKIAGDAAEAGGLCGWSADLPAAVTADYGTVTAQFVCAESGVVTSAVMFTVERGVRGELPAAPSEDAYAEITAAISALAADVMNGYYAARAAYAWRDTAVYGANELVFYAEDGKRGVFLRSLQSNNGEPPFTAEGALNAAYWAEAADFDGIYAASLEAAADAAAAQASAEQAQDSAVSAQTLAGQAAASAQTASAQAQASAASADAALQSSAAAAASAQEALEALEDITEIAGGEYALQSDLQKLIDGTQKAGAALVADSAVNAEYAAGADAAQNAANVTGSIGGKAISSIFESDGVTAKAAAKAAGDGSGNNIAATYVKKTDLIDLVYPIGVIVENYADDRSPAQYIGGSWAQITDDRFLINTGGAYSLGATGGEAAHALTANEMPAHTHTVPVTTSNTASGNSPNYPFLHHADSGVYNTESSSAGGGAAHNNLPPYRAVSRWRRIAG